MKTAKLINQTATLLLAVMLLMVAGARSWSDDARIQKFALKCQSLSLDGHSKLPAGDDQPAVSTLSIDAVITPAISFDFSHYFYSLPQPVWDFVPDTSFTQFAYQETFFLFSCFNRIFGCYIVTNAP